ncbi:MAG: FRG domain-containing protein [Gemmatimonadota bacterium]|nr:FRG domain-containing protein [Gemmatimonadota bacterium]
MTPIEIIQEIVSEAESMSRPAYRGQAKASWELHSGAVHRLTGLHGERIVDDEGGLRKLVSDYHEEHLLRPMQVIDGERKTDLDRLVVLQHQGAATGLLDFTLNPLVALWFACNEEPDNDGKVFMLDVDDRDVAENGWNLKDEGLFTTERAVYYEPARSLGTRVVAQQSLFVICNPPPIPEGRLRSVVVPKEAKTPMTDYLARVGFSERVLFGDVTGLAHANTRRTPLHPVNTLGPRHHRDRGNQAFRAARYDDALAQYQAFAEALPEVAQPHSLVGDALSALGRFREAIDAFTRAIERIERPIDFGEDVIVRWESVGPAMLHALHYNRGNAYAATGDHRNAVADYDEALKHGRVLKRNLLFNRGNSKYRMERFSEAFSDFEGAWLEREGSDVALALGNCKVIMGEFDEGWRQYSAGIGTRVPKSAAAHCRQNAGRVRQLLDALGGHDREVCVKQNVVYVEAGCEPTTLPFVGNPGNAGNTPSGMVNAHGGEGYEGASGFAVVLGPAPG